MPFNWNIHFLSPKVSKDSNWSLFAFKPTVAKGKLKHVCTHDCPGGPRCKGASRIPPAPVPLWFHSLHRLVFQQQLSDEASIHSAPTLFLHLCQSSSWSPSFEKDPDKSSYNDRNARNSKGGKGWGSVWSYSCYHFGIRKLVTFVKRQPYYHIC